MSEPRRSPTLRRRRLSAEIRALREAAKLTSVDATKRLDWSSGKLTRMERGEWLRPNPRDIEDLCKLYGVTNPAKRDELMTLAREGKERGWWHAYKDMLSEEYSTYIGLEAGAREIFRHDNVIIPGLLQTEAYASAVILGGPTEISADQAKNRVRIRMERQKLLTRKEDPLRLWAVMDEAALHREVGGPDVMSAQLAHLLELSELAKVTLQVIPYSVGAHAGVSGGFSILGFPDRADLDAVYVDTPAGELFVEEREEVRRFEEARQRLLASAHTPGDSIGIIAAKAAKS